MKSLDQRSEAKNLLEMNIQEDLASFLVDLKYGDLPGYVVRQTKKIIMDTLGVALATSHHAGQKIYANVLKDVPEPEEATVIGYGFKRSARNAAAINGYMSGYFDFDTGSRWGGVHTACLVVPTALAVAESQNVGGKEFITGVVAGIEIHGRLGEATITQGYARGTSPHGVSNTIAAAATAGKIMRLNKEQMDNALGIAGALSPMVSGFGEARAFWAGDMCKAIANSTGADLGIMAVLLAKQGFIGRTRVFESFCDKLAGPRCWNREVFTRDLGEDFQVSKQYYKPHAACMFTLTTIDCLLAIKKEHPNLSVDDILGVTVKTYTNAAKLIDVHPKSEGRAKFSLPYVVACALLFGRVGIEEFSEEKISDPRILAISRKVTLELAMDAYPDRSSFQTTVEIQMKGGTIYSHREDFHWGCEPENPMTYEDVKNKFVTIASGVISAKKIDKLIEIVYSLEKLDNVNELTQLLY